jgi:uncharacterized protein YbjT (DUF2867 family)
VVILLTGAGGFLGQRLARALARDGHEVICALRQPQRAAALGLPGRVVAADFARDHAPADWRRRLAGVEVVINAVGILRETRRQRFAAVHVAAPRALFAACVEAGVRRVVQVSALGADAAAQSRYHLSKKAADDFLLRLPLSAVIVQPSLIYGPGGASARLFALLASLPLIPLPGRGDQQVQPLHVDDAVAAIVALAASEDFRGQRVALVGPTPLALRGFLAALRGAMGLPPGHFVNVPMSLVRVGATLGGLLPGSLLDHETLRMLERGNTAPPDATRRLLGRMPRAPASFIAAADAMTSRKQAQLAWLLPPLRWSIAAVWIGAGILSLGVYPLADSHALLAGVGVPAGIAPLFLFGAALLDLALGAGTLLLERRRRLLWQTQIAVIIGYTAIITLRLPAFWLHPFGPVLKNLPLLAAIVLLMTLEDD